ncbi:MAG: Type secretion system hydrolase TadA/VirB11/CpaF, TadA subfamily [Planctomycetaceae bacterium]|nr:Type secretion system hydrolase TadA/VirB11/CpaF, TadA subfamily [Planctomycetaceae bacterium]
MSKPLTIQYINDIDSQQAIKEFDRSVIRIGKAVTNDIVLPNHFISDEALVLRRRGTGWELSVLGFNSVRVGEKGELEIHGGGTCLLERSSLIKLFPYNIRLNWDVGEGDAEDVEEQRLDGEMSQLLLKVHIELLSRMDLRVDTERAGNTEDYLFNLEKNIDEIVRLQGVLKPKVKRLKDLLNHVSGRSVRGELISQLLEASASNQPSIWSTGGHWSRMVTASPNLEDELKGILAKITRELKLDGYTDLSERMAVVEQHFRPCWKEILKGLLDDSREYLTLRHVKKVIKDVVFGYGPLEDLLRLPTISEIMVVSRDHIYVERNGVLENSGRQFLSDEVTLSIIERIVAKVGRRIDKAQPLVDARLTDGSRVNAVIPPLAVSGPALTIRKFPHRALLVDDLVNKGALTRTVAEFLRAAVVTRKNILISGGTGTGKTTLLNCLSDFIPDKERIVTIEDTAELQIKKEHVVRMETKLANIEGAGAYTIRDLVKNSLRMRPDRIIVGECRGGEALDMLQAMNTGHDGSMTTIHANSAKDVILRLDVLVQMASDLPIDSIHRQIASALNLVIQLVRLRNGRRMISQVAEVAGIDLETHELHVKDLFLLQDTPTGPVLMPTGRLPTFMEELIESGMIALDSFYL